MPEYAYDYRALMQDLCTAFEQGKEYTLVDAEVEVIYLSLARLKALEEAVMQRDWKQLVVLTPPPQGELEPTKCPSCGGCSMLPGREENDDVMNTACWNCNPNAKSCGNCAHAGELFDIPPLGPHLHCGHPTLEVRDSPPFNHGWGTLREPRETCDHWSNKAAGLGDMAGFSWRIHHKQRPNDGQLIVVMTDSKWRAGHVKKHETYDYLDTGDGPPRMITYGARWMPIDEPNVPTLAQV